MMKCEIAMSWREEEGRVRYERLREDLGRRDSEAHKEIGRDRQERTKRVSE